MTANSVDPIKPANLGTRAEALWSEMVKAGMSVEARVVIAEACRLTDRLDTYDAILNGGAGESVTESALAGLSSEARLTAATLQRILVGLSSAPRGTGTLDAPSAETPTTGTIADVLASRRAARQANAAG